MLVSTDESEDETDTREAVRPGVESLSEQVVNTVDSSVGRLTLDGNQVVEDSEMKLEALKEVAGLPHDPGEQAVDENDEDVVMSPEPMGIILLLATFE